jgi:YggT family protein
MLIIVQIINFLYIALFVLILARIILSFVRIGSYQIHDMVFRLTEPILAPVRNFLPPMGGFDFSPMIVLIAADILRRVLIRLIIG